MVPASRSREGPESMVRVALQLEDGSRLQDTFRAGQTLWGLLSHFPQTRQRLEQPCGATPVCVHMRDEVAGTAELQHRTLRSLGLTGGSAVIRFAMECRDSASTQAPRDSGPEPLLPDSRAPSPPLPTGPAGFSHGDCGQEAAAGPTDDPGELPRPEPTAPVSAAFSGGGQRLGHPLGPVRSLPATATKSQKPVSSPGGPSRPKKSKPGQEPLQELELSMDRSPVVCHPDLEELPPAWPAELPDDFFEVTVDDVRRRLAQLESERKRLEDAPLVTKALREAQAQAKLEHYPQVALRVLFPDRYTLQGFFRPLETVGHLRAFVKSHLRTPELPFYLFTAPPKTLLDDSLTFFQANLFPTALIHFGAEGPPGEGPYLEPQLLARTVAPSAADELVARHMSRATKTPALPPAAPATVPKSEPPLEASEHLPSPVPCPPARRDLGKVPKWLKLPASKR
ncbi:tether containing UBX domain for GLUT4 isoform X2 [Sorex araneus]|nr:tether containing UBX domain for GLUT4 isoform X2 [Sorex araneus]XP_054989011.1 tether containing UBX domain for GLUT4 isoform X2 [Sorex araneus]